MVVALNLLSRALLWRSRCDQNPFNQWRRNHGTHWLPEGVHARPNPDQGPRPDPGTLVGHQTGNNAAVANKNFFLQHTNTLDETGRAAADWFSIWKFLIKSNGGQWTSLIDSYDNFKQFPNRFEKWRQTQVLWPPTKRLCSVNHPEFWAFEGAFLVRRGLLVGLPLVFACF